MSEVTWQSAVAPLDSIWRKKKTIIRLVNLKKSNQYRKKLGDCIDNAKSWFLHPG